MRPRFAVLGCVLTALAAAAVPSVVGAAPKHNTGLTINATPNPILAGESVLIYGQLNGSQVAGQTIWLYQHVADSTRGFTRIARTTTDSHGFYEFTRPEGEVVTNRIWFAREAGKQGVHSRTTYERVAALVSLKASSTTADTTHPVVFSGHVTPDHTGERVLLQEQSGSGDEWTTLKSARLGPDSNYEIAYTWRVPGERDVRVLFPGDDENIRGVSDPVTVTIEQTQVPGFTINSSNPIVDYGKAVTVSGVLEKPGSSKAEHTVVQLWGRNAYQDQFTVLADTMTRSDGSYSFTQMPSSNTVYQVRTAFAPSRHTAVLFEGVRDVVTMTATSDTSEVGQTVTFQGTVTPDKAGHPIYLQRLGEDGEWHTVDVGSVAFNSTFQFVSRFGDAGVFTFRARITSDKANIGSESPPVRITVTPAPVSALPPAS